MRLLSFLAAAVMIAEQRRIFDAQSAPAATGRLHFIFHVPKCAGQTIHQHLSTYAPKETYYRVRPRKGPGRFLQRHHLAGMPDPAYLKAISGHYIGCSLGHIFDGRQIARSVLLRDPVSHFIAHYNFRMMRYISQGLNPYPPDIAYRARKRISSLTTF